MLFYVWTTSIHYSPNIVTCTCMKKSISNSFRLNIINLHCKVLSQIILLLSIIKYIFDSKQKLNYLAKLFQLIFSWNWKMKTLFAFWYITYCKNFFWKRILNTTCSLKSFIAISLNWKNENQTYLILSQALTVSLIP